MSKVWMGKLGRCLSRFVLQLPEHIRCQQEEVLAILCPGKIEPSSAYRGDPVPVHGPSRHGGAQGTVHFGLPIGGATPVDGGWFYSTGQGGVPSLPLCTQGSQEEPGRRSKAQEAPN